MDFFQAQDEARKRTRWLVVMFVMAVGAVVICVNLLTWWAGGFFGLYKSLGVHDPTRSPEVFLTVTVLTLVIVLGSSFFKSLDLRRGGAVVARDLGGRPVEPHTTDPHEKRLLNVVEEMAIASGVPAPQVFLLEEEAGINAFAAGTEPSNAVVAVTRGCLLRLSRAELQGVVAHEFSHILNGDMRLNMRLIGMVFGLMAITLMGRGMLSVLRYVRPGRGDNRGAGGLILVMLVLGGGLFVIGAIGSFFGRLIQAAISRQREYLADASAVQFTREPDGIAGALKKIGGLHGGSKLHAAKAMEASHMLFADGGMFAFGMATHPPLAVRIRAIQESWDGKFVESGLPPLGAEKEAASAGPGRAAGSLRGVVDTAVLSALGDPGRMQVEVGQLIRNDIDRDLLGASHSRDEAQALVFGLLLAEDEQLRVGEREFLEKTVGERAARAAVSWSGQARALGSAQKIAVVDLCIPTLRRLTRPEYERFAEVLRWLMASDGEINLFEFMLQHLVRRHLATHFDQLGFPPIRYRRMSDLAREADILCSAMARVGREDPALVSQAWQAVIAEWGNSECWRPQLVGASECGPAQLEQALKCFDAATPLVKKQLLRLCGLVVAQDGQLSDREAELLRATADAIGGSVPPLVHQLEG